MILNKDGITPNEIKPFREFNDYPFLKLLHSTKIKDTKSITIKICIKILSVSFTNAKKLWRTLKNLKGY